jgi:diamine N-acetyltransferase
MDASNQEPRYFKNEEVTLRAIEAEDVDLLYEWENDEETWKFSHTIVPFSKYILALYIKNSDKDIYESKQLRLIINTPEGKPVGAIDLFDFDPYHSRAGIGLLIHKKEDRSKGYASAALELIINYSFNKLGMHQLWANIASDNEPSLRLFEKFNFSICGTKKEWLKTGKEWVDEYMLQLIAPQL